MSSVSSLHLCGGGRNALTKMTQQHDSHHQEQVASNPDPRRDDDDDDDASGPFALVYRVLAVAADSVTVN